MKSSYSFKPLISTLKEIIIPSGEQVVLSVLAAALTLFAVFFNYFFKLVTSDPLSTTYLEEAATGYVKKLDSVPLADQATSILLWGLIGVIAYVGTIVFVNLAVSVAESLNIIKKGTKKRFDGFDLLDGSRRLVWVFLSCITLALTFLAFVPALVAKFKNGLLESATLEMIFSVILLSMVYYLTFMIVWAAVRNPHLVSRK